MKSKYEENLISLTSEASIKNMRRYVVTKPNNFVKEVPYPKLTVIQNRIFCFLISLVQPEDTSFKNVNFDIDITTEIFSGIVVSNNEGTIENCTISGSAITSQGDYRRFSGICAHNQDGIIIACVNNISVTVIHICK